MSEILKFTDALLVDESIDEYEYHEYDPITGSNLNHNHGEVIITIESQDLLIVAHPKRVTW